MQPLDAFPSDRRRRVKGLFADIDDTITTDGRLTAEALAALETLQCAGLLVVPITGRPAGWCDHIARMWPVDAVVGENGAFFFRYDHATRRFTKRYLLDDDARAENRWKFQDIARDILAQVPGAAISADQHYREADLAIDYCEDVKRLDDAAVDRIVALMQARGMTAKISSIHVNGWFGDYDKLTMTRIVMDECFGIDLDRDKDDFVFVGDSPNDQPLFRYFPNAIGVANIKALEKRLVDKPAYVTKKPAGGGLAEVAAALLVARG